jgi:hypothetical protein
MSSSSSQSIKALRPLKGGIVYEDDEGQPQTKTTFRINTDLFWDLKRMALDERTNVTELINEAIYDLFVKRGKRKAKK